MSGVKEPRRPSIASDGQGAVFYWRHCAGSGHVDAAADALLAALDSPFRYQNVYTREMVRARFRDLLVGAEEGTLPPEDAVKRIRRAPDIFMYELRWGDIPVTPIDPVSGDYGDPMHLLARLYYVEQAGFRWMLGLHTHEKRIAVTEEETRAWQDGEIDRALGTLRAGAKDCCGVPEISMTLGQDGLDV